MGTTWQILQKNKRAWKAQGIPRNICFVWGWVQIGRMNIMIDGRTEDNNTNEIRQSTSKIWLRTDSRTTPKQYPSASGAVIYSYQVSKKSAKALPRYGSGHKNAYSKKHLFKIQRAISLFLTDGVQCHLACIILLCIYILIPSLNEICQSASKLWLRTQKCL